MPTRLFLLLLKTNRATLLFKSPRDDLQRKIRGEILFFFFFFILQTSGTTSSIPSHSIQSPGLVGRFGREILDDEQSREFIRNNTGR